MGLVKNDVSLPGNISQTIQLDNNPATFDTSVYNIAAFNTIISKIINIIPNYTVLLSEYSSLFELYKKYNDENENYDSTTQKQFTTILKNERNTYYKEQGIESLHSYYYWLLIVYIMIIIVFVISMFVFPSDWSIMKKIILLLVLIILPFGSSYIMEGIIRLGHGIYNLLPKNAYLDA